MLWIIYSKLVLTDSRPNALGWMMDEAQNLNLKSQLMFAEDFDLHAGNALQVYYKGQAIDMPEGVFMRCYDLALAKFFEALGIRVFNKAIPLETSRNKWLTHISLAKNKLSSPQSILCRKDTSFESLQARLGLPFILKDSFGSHGDQVYLIKTCQDYDKHLETCSQGLAQKYIQDSHGRDLRVHVIGDKVVACVLRQSHGSFLSNYAQGGQALAYTIDPEARDLAIGASQALDLDFAGVDLLFDGGSYTVCEVNGIPGFRTLGLTSKENIPQLMLAYIKEHL